MSSIIGKKKILLATGIFPPDIGGPATYVLNLAKELMEKGHAVSLVSFGEQEFPISDFQFQNTTQEHQFQHKNISRKAGKFSRYLNYFTAVWQLAPSADLVIAFDLSSSGIPALLAAKLRGKKTLVRLGGDFLWEKAFARGWTDKPLAEFYGQKRDLSLQFLYAFNYLLLRFFDKVIFTSEWQRAIYAKYFGLAASETSVIKNAFFEPAVSFRPESARADHRNLIFAGRLIKLKNLDRVIEALSELDGVNLDIYGEGPEEKVLRGKIEKLKLGGRVRLFPKLSHDLFMEKLAQSRAALVPSISEISPVTMLECIRLGQPALVTKNCGYYEDFKDDLVFIDPLDLEDMKEKIKLIFNEKFYQDYIDRIKRIATDRNYRNVAEEWLELI